MGRNCEQSRENTRHVIYLLTNGTPKIEPFEISDSTRQIGFLSYNLLAAGTIDSVLLYDVERGVLVRSIGVSGMMSDTKDWSMTCRQQEKQYRTPFSST
jgi:hypothetical protein